MLGKWLHSSDFLSDVTNFKMCAFINQYALASHYFLFGLDKTKIRQKEISIKGSFCNEQMEQISNFIYLSS